MLLGTVDLIEAEKDYNRRKELRRSAFESFTLACELEPSNPTIQNLLSNQHFFAWFPLHTIMKSSISGPNTVVVNVNCPAQYLVPGNLVRMPPIATTFIIRESKVYSSEESDGSQIFELQVEPEFTVAQQLELNFGDVVNVKNLASSAAYASRALSTGYTPSLRAESNYLLGRVHFSQRNYSSALEFFKKSLKEKSDFSLAAYGIAQVHFERKEYKQSLDLFEKVLNQNPSDRDSLCYVSLLRAMLRNEATPLEKVREAVSGFQYDAEVWKMQALVRHNHSKTDNFEEALRCYLYCKECYENRQQSPSIDVLNNMSILYLSSGKKELACQYAEAAIRGCSGSSSVYQVSDAFGNEAFFEDLLYRWKEDSYSVSVDLHDHDLLHLNESSAKDWAEELIFPNSAILVEDALCHVVEAGTDYIRCKALVRIWGSDSSSHLRLRTKLSLNTFNSRSLQYWYNYAIVLISMHSFHAATLILEELLLVHPSFEDCTL